MKGIILIVWILSLLLVPLSGCVDISQRLENAARLAWVDYDRVESAPPSGRCSLSPINWEGERVAIVLVLRSDMWGMFSKEAQRHIRRQFDVRLAQRGAIVVDSSLANYEMRVLPHIQYDLVFFQITVLNRDKRPVAYNLAQHRLETPWFRLTERVKGELLETMILNAFVRLCAGLPSWQWYGGGS